MNTQTAAILARHYAPNTLLANLHDAIQVLGKAPDMVTADDLAPMDEFHVGSREATEALLAPLQLQPSQRLLDVGCGLGGAARFVASCYGCSVTGVDLTAEFVEVGNELCRWLGLSDKVDLQQGDILSLPLASEQFDGAYMIHVGMNIRDKAALFKEVARTIKPGGFFAIFDLMRMTEGDITFPVPWSGGPETSFVATQADYQAALQAAGLQLQFHRNRHAYALDFYHRMKRLVADSGPGPIGLHLLMGTATETRLSNAYGAMEAGIIAPVEMVARREC